jgi:hypothetical protein
VEYALESLSPEKGWASYQTWTVLAVALDRAIVADLNIRLPRQPDERRRIRQQPAGTFLSELFAGKH